MSLEINELESKRFGITAARLLGAATDLAQVNDAAKALGVDMISSRVAADNLARVHQLEADGYRLMDTLVYYSCSLPGLKTPLPPPRGFQQRHATPGDAAAVARVAQVSFKGYWGHYHADPRLDDAAADAAYVEWAQTSIESGETKTPALLVEQGDSVVGFLTLHHNSREELEIVLNAIHPQHQRVGLYAYLISGATHLGAESGATRIIVSTQINNYAVQRVWARHGFVLNRSLYTFHKWFT